jgi:L-seryl-tRNA(Ser) seleniumtransferase
MEVGVYERLGVRRVINADATLTRLGGSLIPSDVFDAMREAAGSFVDIYELQEAVGKRLAELTRNEAAYVSTGAAAGIVLTTLAAMTDGDLPTIARLIETGETPKDEVIIQRVHRIPYDPAIRLAGARIVDVGNRLQTFPWELEAAITPRTAMIFYAAGDHLASGALSHRQSRSLTLTESRLWSMPQRNCRRQRIFGGSHKSSARMRPFSPAGRISGDHKPAVSLWAPRK